MNNGIIHSAKALNLAIKFQDTRAQNIANANTVGYQRRIASAEAFSTSLRAAAGLTLPDYKEEVDHSPGMIRHTGQELDLAIDGKGWFTLETDRGERYSRNGEFRIDRDGQLSAFDGTPVLGEAGPIILDPARGPVAVDSRGEMTQDNESIGRLRVVQFQDDRNLVPEGDGRYRASPNDEPAVATDSEVQQGYLEHSNVNVIDEMVQMISGFRAFEAAQKAMMANDRIHAERIGARP